MKQMRRLILTYLYASSLCGMDALAQTAQPAQPTQTVLTAQTERHTYLKVCLELHLDSLRLGKKEARVFTPVLSDGENRQPLHPVVVNGRWRHLMYLRGKEGGRESDGEKESTYVLQGGRQTDAVPYMDSCLYQPWMRHAKLWLAEDLCGCGGAPMAQSLRLLADRLDVSEEKNPTSLIASTYESLIPTSTADTTDAPQYKIAKVTLYLDYLSFPINRMDILPDFGNNRQELQKLSMALDSLLTLPGHHIELVAMTGYASPDGPYRRNGALAYGRTLALRDYLQGTVRYRELPFRTASVAEDWEGLKTALENSDMAYKEELLMIIGSDLPPDRKELNMKTLDGGKAYRILKRDFLPGLRRTVCEIHYKPNE